MKSGFPSPLSIFLPQSLYLSTRLGLFHFLLALSLYKTWKMFSSALVDNVEMESVVDGGQPCNGWGAAGWKNWAGARLPYVGKVESKVTNLWKPYISSAVHLPQGRDGTEEKSLLLIRIINLLQLMVDISLHIVHHTSSAKAPRQVRLEKGPIR